MTTILMGSENATGWKLEELAAQLRQEVHDKAAKIAPKAETDATALRVHTNNMRIIALLTEIEAAQRDSYHALYATKGANPGPDPAKPLGRLA